MLAQARSKTQRAAALLALVILDRDADRDIVLAALQEVPLFEYVHDRRRADDPVLRAAVAAARRTNGVAMQAATATSREAFLDTLVRELGSDPHPEHRVRILETLGARHGADAYPAVWRSFRKDPSAAVRVAALRVLASAAPADDFARALADALEDPQPELRAEALRRLGSVPPERATPLLLAHLENGAPEARAALVESLAALPASHLESFLDAAMGSDLGLRAREVVIQVLGRTPHFETRPLLEAYMEAQEPALRSASLHALGAVPGAHAADLIAAALGDPDVEVRSQATHAAGALGVTRGAPILRQALGDPEPVVRRLALLHLARMRAPGAPDDLRAACSDPEAAVRAAALAGLALTGTTAVETWIGPRDVPAIAAALRDLVPAAECVRRLAQAREPEVRLGALRALFLGDATARAAALATARRDPAPEVRTVGRQLESVLATWLEEPGARTWLEGGGVDAPADAVGSLAPRRPAAKSRRAPAAPKPTEVKR
jgi:HEAT repeat protein